MGAFLQRCSRGDGLVGVAEGAELTEGAFVEVLITDAEEHDLFAEISGN